MDIFFSYLVFGLIVFGISWVITKSKLFHSLREYLLSSYVYRTDQPMYYIQKVSNFLHSLINCIVCTSIWVGMLLSLVAPYTFLTSLTLVYPITFFEIIAYGAISGAITILLATFTGDLD